MKKIKIDSKTISEQNKPFIIAEAGVNYYDIAKKMKIGLLEAAKLMIKKAAESGADAIKFQTYKAEKLASKYSPAYWDTSKEKTKSQYELFKKFDKFEEKEYIELADYAKKKNIIFLSTPFDEEAVDFLDKLVPAFKIASADITNFPLIKKISDKKKPIFLSTGAATLKEIEEAIKIIRKEGNDQIVLLHCVLNYPTLYKNAELKTIVTLKQKFPEYLIGYSDHTIPDECMLVTTTAILLGAVVIEKHFTLDKTLPGNDHYHAMDPQDLKKIVKNIELVKVILGKGTKDFLENESLAIKYARRSIVAAKDIKKGQKITADLIIMKRPGTGISPIYTNLIIGKRAKRDIKEDEILQWEDLS